MANNTGKKYGGRTKGTPNKITTEVINKSPTYLRGLEVAELKEEDMPMVYFEHAPFVKALTPP